MAVHAIPRISTDSGRTAGRRHLLSVATAAVLAALALPALANPQASDLVKTELIAELGAVRAAEPFWVGIRLTMKEHWHTYWRNPGDSGEATQVRWTLPPGFSAGELQWPAPSLIRVGPTASFGYEGEAILVTRITPPQRLEPGQDVQLSADVAYLVCEKICIPGEAKVSLPLAAVGSETPSGPHAEVFAQARRKLPQPSPWPARFAADAKTITLTFDTKDQGASIRAATLFPHDNLLIDNAAPQGLETADSTRLILARSALAAATPSAIDGVLVVEEDLGGRTVTHAFAVSAGDAGAAGVTQGGIGLLPAILLAMLAGIILNLMPCVFPVLSIKVLHLTQQAGETAARVRLHGLAYTAGILASFAALAGVLHAVRAAGAEVGWGFQMQSPAVVAALAFVIFAMGLSLSGIFTIGTALARVGNTTLAHAPGLTGSFFTGVLATIVATPCTAPFMGAAIGFALTQSFPTALTVFLALGFGLAFPLLVLSVVPRWRHWLPRPGPWMDTLKQLLAFPLYATAAWLIWVLSQQVGSTGLLAALSGLVLIGFGAWTFNMARERHGTFGRVLQGVAAVCLIGVAALAATVETDRTGSGAITAATSAAEAEPFTQHKLDALLASDRPVFVNLTAAWCITCLVNERTALSTDAVREAFAQSRVAYLKGDWTNRNPEITRMLERFGRSGVPLYVLYRRGKDPIVLPQILTESLVIDHITRL
jgi:thiol:disulfide interchange protein DsbD